MNQTTPPPSAGPGPGAVLRQARTERRLSVEDIARELNLSPSRIAALERDDYQSLPGATYVRGYLRRYACLLGLAPETVLDSFNRLPGAAQPVDLVAPAPVRQISSNDSLIKLGTLLVVGVMVGLAIIWWQGQERVAPPNEPVVPPVALGEPPAVEAAVQAPVAEEAAPPPAPPRAEAPVARAPTEPATSPAPATGSDAREVVIDPNAPRARLVLYVTEESWADVRDAAQRRLIYETVPAGRVVTIEGVSPLSVFIGNIDGVRVELNGREYDARRHKRGQVARFVVGDSANATP